MAIYLVSGLQIVAQPTDGVCWWASDTMLYKWSQKSGRGSMIDPLADSCMKSRYENNGDWSSGNNALMASKLNMVQISSLDLDYWSLVSAFTKHGPIFASVQKNWHGNNYGHAVVLGGVADTGVLVYDPEPINKGTRIWLTWDQIKKAVEGIEDPTPQYLAAV